jgi:hypothetical protein
MILLFAGGGGALGLTGFVWYYFSPEFTQVGYAPAQPVAYSHKQHPGLLAMDCRYCHTGVEQSPYANLPATQTCMNCHKVVMATSDKLALIRKSYNEGTAVAWVRVHRLADYVHFNHSAHLHAGVGCASCHGRIDQMAVVRQVAPLSMGWCLNCHRHPESFLRPRERVTDIEYVAQDPGEGARLLKEYKVQPPEFCSACHY